MRVKQKSKYLGIFVNSGYKPLNIIDKFGSSFYFRLFNDKATIVDSFLSPLHVHHG